MREILIYAAGASIAATVFLVALVELIFTRRRRKIDQEISEKMKALKASYNESVNKMVLEEESKLEEADERTEALNKQLEEERATLEKDFKTQLDDIQTHTQKEIAAAKAKAKKLHEEAQLKAEEYLESRKKEVEEELMNLVISVTKKVLPEGLAYDTQKELVMQALRDVKAPKHSSK